MGIPAEVIPCASATVNDPNPLLNWKTTSALNFAVIDDINGASVFQCQELGPFYYLTITGAKGSLTQAPLCSLSLTMASSSCPVSHPPSSNLFVFSLFAQVL